MPTLEGIKFDGPYEPRELPDEGGVYLVTRTKGVLIDCGRSEKNIRDRIAGHDRKDCWEEHKGDEELSFFVHVSHKEAEQMLIERLVRDNNFFPCGED